MAPMADGWMSFLEFSTPPALSMAACIAACVLAVGSVVGGVVGGMFSESIVAAGQVKFSRGCWRDGGGMATGVERLREVTP